MSTTVPVPSAPDPAGAAPRAGIARRALLRGAGMMGVATATGATLTTAPALAADAPTAVTPDSFTLTADYATDADVVDALVEQAGRASVGEVMDTANHERTPVSGVVGGQRHGFRFASGDENDSDVAPQGITTTRDAVGTTQDGRYDGRQLIAVSFHNSSPKGSRINLIDWDSDHPNRYRRILLVNPTGTPEEPSFEDVPIHVGGIAWYGNLLYVADTGTGMRVFDMTRILTTDTGGDKEQIGRVGDTFYAHQYRYALPQVGTITSHVEGEELVWSTISLDRSSTSIVMTEYRCTDCDYPGGTTRAVRFPFAPDSTRFAATTTATEAFEVPLHNLNGVGSYDGTWWFNSSNSTHQTLYAWSGSGEMTSHDWVNWGESLSYWKDEDGPDLLWSLREETGDRPVFAVAASDYGP
ncbi:hypothetical protein [Brachybacterium sacelli]|uniref:Uncharacterized protein n=1 Tax=Brachybacterium sacelli TaxID=173364 RepID=A0ABS4X857_9MICO|nr:hypothetical protein [Brachybacterium sacelli]MBP2383889.1 hypothetical protein [Brachybacterium sacelli]